MKALLKNEYYKILWSQLEYSCKPVICADEGAAEKFQLFNGLNRFLRNIQCLQSPIALRTQTLISVIYAIIRQLNHRDSMI